MPMPIPQTTSGCRYHGAAPDTPCGDAVATAPGNNISRHSCNAILTMLWYMLPLLLTLMCKMLIYCYFINFFQTGQYLYANQHQLHSQHNKLALSWIPDNTGWLFSFFLSFMATKQTSNFATAATALCCSHHHCNAATQLPCTAWQTCTTLPQAVAMCIAPHANS